MFTYMADRTQKWKWFISYFKSLYDFKEQSKWNKFANQNQCRQIQIEDVKLWKEHSLNLESFSGVIHCWVVLLLHF